MTAPCSPLVTIHGGYNKSIQYLCAQVRTSCVDMDFNENKEVPDKMEGKNNPDAVLNVAESNPQNEYKGTTPNDIVSGLLAEYPFAWIHAGGSKFIVKAGSQDIPYPAFPISNPFLSGSCWMVMVKWEGWSHKESASVECSCCKRIDLGDEGLLAN